MNSTEDKVITLSMTKKLSRNRLIKNNSKSENETEIDDNDTYSNEDQEAREEKTNKLVKIMKKQKRNGFKAKGNKGCEDSTNDLTKLEDNAFQVQERFKYGCECQDDQCFKGLDPEVVYKHRLNIAELTKAEHDMYLMGLIRSCLSNPYETSKHTERQRLRAHYVYQGRRVCLDAFLYLENCTHYQIKRIRKHLTLHGVSPRVHGNYGKVPHNTFSLDIYQIATNFVKNFIKEQELKQKTKATNNSPLHLTPDITRKTVHNLYKEYCQNSSPSVKIMGYSTFRTFLKVQFPQLKFAKLEFVARIQNLQNQSNSNNNSRTDSEKIETVSAVLQPTQIVSENGHLVPILFASEIHNEPQTYILTAANKLQHHITYRVTNHKKNISLSASGGSVTIKNMTTS